MARPEEWTERKANALGRKLVKWFEEDDGHILFEEFLVIDQGLYPDLTQYLLRKFPHSDFAHDVRRAKKMQEIRLIKAGLFGKANAMQIFCLKVHHGYSEQAGVMGREAPKEVEEVVDTSTKTPEDLLKDVKKQLGKD